ncbi:hypothetical protein [Fodinibius sp.]|uniref:hypothetical protein n=1 Tax=Fodinibius sp. TaxID=1872440 RepID=UPI002ACD2839|nr:hypothetical protein [Fodinibius sp.]MDZ7658043.1 hypothetical protein [Fodinibius sp.]
MKPGDKDIYKCYQCGDAIIVGMVDKGTVPTFPRCVSRSCDGMMHRAFNPVDATGRRPTYQLVRDPDAKTDKLKLQKINEADNADSQNHR